MEVTETEQKELLEQNFDRVVNSFMERYKISQGAACVMKDGEVLIHKGYGTDKETLFRIASITKTFTRVGIMQLVEQGKISLDTQAFPLLDLAPLPGEEFNTDLNKITISQLINHQAGWDQSIIGDITFNRPTVAKALNKADDEVTPTDMVRYMLNKPLQYEPGTKDRVYCNFGYAVLGRVIEKASGQNYYDYTREHITKPLGLETIQSAHTPKDKVLPNEATYEKDSDGNNYEDPYKSLCFEMADSEGGLISSASDLCKFLNHFWGNGYPRKEQTGHYFYVSGRCVGTLTLGIQRKDGVNIAILFNNRHNRDFKKDEQFQKDVEKVFDTTSVAFP